VSEHGPLSGLAVRVACEPASSARTAADLLGLLGAEVHVAAGHPAGVAVATPGGGWARACAGPRDLLAEVRLEAALGLPRGTVAHAVGLCLAAAAGAAALAGRDVDVDPEAVAAQLALPLLLAAAHGGPPPPVLAPVAVADGAIWADLDAGQRALLKELLGGEPPSGRRARDVAELGQAAGLPLADFRPPPLAPPPPLAELAPLGPPRAPPAAPGLGDPPLAGVRVCDLTTMWSGPLATWLLASLGADVLKVEPACRLDGTRGVDGRSLGPDGLPVAGDLDRSTIFQALNRNKRRLDLDLRIADQRAAFLEQVDASDLVVSNSSPRVPANLGIEPATLAADRARPLGCVQMPAFPAGSAERDWRAYGHGIHAVSGLGIDSDGRPWTAGTPYPDALSGFAAAAVAVALRVGAVREGASWAAEVPMLAVARGLAARVPRGPAAGAAAGLADDDARAATLAACLERATVRIDTPRGRFVCPRSPFRSDTRPIAETPAPLAGREVAA
jgi:crotonobetainyl-CoA:carnitine CoA-transferase CaiB-like acyl-CoA transferase